MRAHLLVNEKTLTVVSPSPWKLALQKGCPEGRQVEDVDLGVSGFIRVIKSCRGTFVLVGSTIRKALLLERQT